MLLEQLHYNLLFPWFVVLSPDDEIWHPTTYSLLPTSSMPKTESGSPMSLAMGRFLE